MICLKSFPSQVQPFSGPGGRYPMRLWRSPPSGLCARPQNPQSTRGRGWLVQASPSSGSRLGQDPRLPPFCSSGLEDGAPGDSREPTLPSTCPLCSEFYSLQVALTCTIRDPSPLPLSSLAPSPGTFYPRAGGQSRTEPQMGYTGRGALTIAPKLKKFVAPPQPL